MVQAVQKGIIFDMDGTLLDNMDFHKKAWMVFLEKHGIHISDEEFMEKNHGIISEIVPRFFDRTLSSEETMNLGMEKERIYREMYRPFVKPLPGLKTFLQSLSESGARLALATAADQLNIDFTLDALGIENYFSAITGSEEVKAGKPNPEVYLVSARKLCIQPAQCIAFEDSFSGIEAALNAGMEVVAVATTHTRKELTRFPVKRIIGDYKEILPEMILA